MFMNQDECFQTITSTGSVEDQSLEELRQIDYESLYQRDSSLRSESGLAVARESAATSANTLWCQQPGTQEMRQNLHNQRLFQRKALNERSFRVSTWLNTIPDRDPKDNVADTAASKSFFGLSATPKTGTDHESAPTLFRSTPLKKKDALPHVSKQNIQNSSKESVLSSLPKTKAVTTFSCHTSGHNSDKDQSVGKSQKNVLVVSTLASNFRNIFSSSLYDLSAPTRSPSTKGMDNDLSSDNPAPKPALTEEINPSGYQNPFRSISTMAADLLQSLTTDNSPVKVASSVRSTMAPPTNLFGSQSTATTILPSFGRSSSPPQSRFAASASKFDVPPSFSSASNQQQSKLGSVFGECGRYMLLHHTGDNKASGADEQLRTTPLLSLAVKEASEARKSVSTTMFPQYAFLGCRMPDVSPEVDEAVSEREPEPILLNTNTPWSAFICGSQGSGKSYTLSAIIENCLFASPKIGVLPKPLAGAVFHNNTASSHNICEAAHLVSLGVRVNILVSRSNYHALSSIYKAAISPSAAHLLKIQPLVLQSHHLTAERMHRLMAFQESENTVPLYMEVIMRILREMAITGLPFNYATFKANLDNEGLQPGQKVMMDMRLNLLESFLDPSCVKAAKPSKSSKKSDMFATAPGTLTIVDLSDPFLDSSTTCTLFDILLSLFILSRPESGLLLCLDEAHKFMKATSAAETFTENLLTVIREQRHNACRVVIATQEPTISPKLLDLCSFTLVHRFTSPDWLATLRGHLAGASDLVTVEQGQGKKQRAAKLFEQIINLDVGESLLFAPSAFLEEDETGRAKKLGTQCVRFKTRVRLGTDGGKSILAVRD
ncbi:hypothetical protein E4T39_03586 [Aureobasidium subglaciale]|nr:hypothetical protein E4T39_03586 [Aureobasidium subglaciale]